MNYEIRWYCLKSLPGGWKPDPILQVRQKLAVDVWNIRLGEQMINQWSEWTDVPFVSE